jgi:SOS response regulatory protein OraA/RecX
MQRLTLTDILDDLRAADKALRSFEQRYWLSSEVFYQIYSQGLLDDGSHAEDFAEWAGHYQLKLKREGALRKLSQQRIEALQHQAEGKTLELAPQEPVVDLS